MRFKPDCVVCRRSSHAKWHDCTRGEINPIALIQMVESLNDDGTSVVRCVVDWVVIMTGMNVPKMRAMLEVEQARDAVGKRPEAHRLSTRASHVSASSSPARTP